MFATLSKAARGAFWGAVDAVSPGHGATWSEPTARLYCQFSGGETLEVASLMARDSRHPNFVGITYADRGEEIGTVVVPAGMARAFAAAVLNEADKADGTTPLLYMPKGPEVPEPPAVVAS